MGLESRDWYRTSSDGMSRAVRARRIAVLLAIGVAVVGAAAAVRLATQPTPASYGGVERAHGTGFTISLLPGLPAIRLGGDPLYAPSDPWQRYLAEEGTCPGGEDVDAPLVDQVTTMVCLVDHARRVRGLAPVRVVRLLNDTSLAKARRIDRCDQFDHDACGVDAAAEARALGYGGAWGENLYIANGRYAAPRPALDAWLNSPEHRENLFLPQWRTMGLAVEQIPRFGRDRDMTLWVNQFGA